MIEVRNMCYGPADAVAADAEAMAECRKKFLEAYHIYEQSYQSYFDDADWNDEDIWDSFMSWIKTEFEGTG
jgi:hypothetical protein